MGTLVSVFWIIDISVACTASRAHDDNHEESRHFTESTGRRKP